MAKLELEVAAWLEAELDASACASVKRSFLDLQLLEQSEGSDFSRFLWMCRIIAADHRVVWEHLSPSFTEAFKRPVDAWNEQLAVKVLRLSIDRMNDTAAASRLREALDEHMTTTMKPATATPHIGSQPVMRGVVASPYLVLPAAPGVEGSLVCNAPLPAFGDLLRVPRENMFFIDTVVQYCELGRVVHASAELSGMISGDEPLLVLCLVYERYVASSSHWSDLLLSCPSEYPTVPSFWDWDDLAELEGLDVLDDVLAKRAQLVQYHTTVMTVLPLIYEAFAGSCRLGKENFLDCFSIEAMMWARATFDSRAFNLNVDGRVVLALVPVADMINHHNHSNVLVRKVEPDGGDFVMQIGASLTAEDVGRELWMSYGPLQNWELLQFYGFVMEENEHDRLPFPFDLPEGVVADEWDGRRAALVAKYALHLAGRCWIGRDGRPPPALLALLRVHLAQAGEFDGLERHGPFVSLSAATEAGVVATIAETIRCILDLFGTSLEDDERLLKKSGSAAAAHADNDAGCCTLSCNKRMSILLRVELKRIAHRTLEWCATAAADSAHGA
ncbi:SET domain containing protein [Trypanosoma rangeli]|uniref:SET domain containing protein n=1 Tax=Trypanosoma rangeli TaxID=5698 RepID=A0A422N122_TRYRA|nr:SET domain containing protein [Trypanosoma rangeli]RNE99165.1 SET domain containing protein [Trypanosoma rangeli]|eukprot:RNE99165.1 SET domain containing protein [Trypanosoma rangeli]